MHGEKQRERERERERERQQACFSLLALRAILPCRVANEQ